MCGGRFWIQGWTASPMTKPLGALVTHSSTDDPRSTSPKNAPAYTKMFRFILALMVFNLAFVLSKQDAWGIPGCHRVGHTRKVSIPNCVEFSVTTNACRGYCESWAVPSPPETVMNNPLQGITSIGQCCNIMETEDVEVSVLCLDGTRDLVFKSAKNCSCYHCKKD